MPSSSSSSSSSAFSSSSSSSSSSGLPLSSSSSSSSSSNPSGSSSSSSSGAISSSSSSAPSTSTSSSSSSGGDPSSSSSSPSTSSSSGQQPSSSSGQPSTSSSSGDPSSSSSTTQRHQPGPCGPCDCNCEWTENPVRFFNGEVKVETTDISTAGFGLGWGHTRRYTNRIVPDFTRGQGWNWNVENWPYLVQSPYSFATYGLYGNIYTTDWFKEEQGGSFTTLFGRLKTLKYDGVNEVFRLEEADGTVLVFHDFSHPTRPGGFSSITSPGGNTTSVDDSINEDILDVQRSYTQGEDEITESFFYEFFESGEHSEYLARVTLRRRVNEGAWQYVQKAEYTYYGSNDDFGSLNDLQTVTRFEWDPAEEEWIALDVHYYRYWKEGDTNGFAHGIRYVVGPENWKKLSAAVSNPLTATNNQVAPFADRYFEYDAQRRCTKEVVHGGSRTFTLDFYDNPSYVAGPAPQYNVWYRRTTETLPDGSQRIVYTNDVGYTILGITKDGDDEWCEFRVYDAEGRVTGEADAAAITGYDEDYPDLMGFDPQSGKYQYIRDDAGLLRVTEYYATTGGVAARGYPKARWIRNGEDGTPIKLVEYEYENPHTDAAGATVFPVSREIVHPDDGDPDKTISTSYAYTYHAGTNQVEQKTTTLPAVPTAQNGSGVANTMVDVFDLYGNRIWRKDERGFITRWKYDIKTKALTQRIDDVDSGLVSDAPAGWSTPAGGGLHLVTDYAHDDQGRTTQVLGPAHTIDVGGTATEVRRAEWTVYQDADDEIWTAQGWQKMSDSSFTLVNPVTIQKYDKHRNLTDELRAVRASTAGKLQASDSFAQSSWVRWTSHQYSDCCKLVATRVYHTIPSSGEGSSGTHYDQTEYGYDLRDRRNRVRTPGGTITATVFDVRGLPVEVYVGTDDSGATDDDPTGNGDPDNDMVLVTENEYDGGAAGGDGNLTQVTQHVTDQETRVTGYSYDWRNRRTETDGEVDFCEQRTYDNLDRVTKVERYDTTTSGNLIARSETRYDDLGRVYRSVRYGVDPATGTVGNSLTDNTWYDKAGNVAKSLPSGAKLFTKTVYDGLNRPVTRSVGFDVDETGYADALSVTDDTLLEQTETVYDDAGNVVQTTHRQRYHDATGTGELGTPSSGQPKARVTYVAGYQDALGRVIATANYGTNGGSTLSRPATVPARSDTVLVTSTTHDAAGMVQDVTDPAGMVTRTEYDDAGRRTKVIENYQQSGSSSSSSSGTGCAPSDDVNRETRFTYTPDGALATLTAVNADTGNQVTTYSYGTTLTESEMATSTLLRKVAYPDSTGDSDTVKYTYNRQAERTSVTDQRGCVRSFDYDKLGRLIHDQVTTLGTGVDGAVRRLSTTYEVRGLPEKLTSHDNAAVGQGSIVNEVQLAYNDFGQVVTSWQAHSGAVNTSTSPKVQYQYADGSENTIRPTLLVYPDGREVEYDYGSSNGVDDAASRVRELEDGGSFLLRCDYLGLGTAVEVTYPFRDINLPGGGGYTREMKYTLVGTQGGNDPDTGDVYRGLDRFGRVKDSRWVRYHNGTPADIDRIKYGYDRASNRIWRENPVAASLSKEFDELYAHDGLHRLKHSARGTLDSGHSTLNSQTFAQCWTLDATGNWKGFRQDDDGDGSWDLAQQRTANAVNEITGVSETVGPAWVTPGYDAAGNMTTVPQPADPTTSYTATYDAWNRLVKLVDGSDTVQENVYDARRYRTVRKDYASGVLDESRHFYYTEQWQSVEERVGSAATAERQHVWGLRYIDDLVLRERDTDGSGTLDESLYALQDANWNVTAAVTGLYDVEERYAYTAYGEAAVLDEGFGARTVTNHAWDVLYAAYRWDGGTGLYAVRNRVLHAALSCWNRRDPMEYERGARLYEYSSSCPLNHVDPLGLEDITIEIYHHFEDSTTKQYFDKIKDDLQRIFDSCLSKCGRVSSGEATVDIKWKPVPDLATYTKLADDGTFGWRRGYPGRGMGFWGKARFYGSVATGEFALRTGVGLIQEWWSPVAGDPAYRFGVRDNPQAQVLGRTQGDRATINAALSREKATAAGKDEAQGVATVIAHEMGLHGMARVELHPFGQGFIDSWPGNVGGEFSDELCRRLCERLCLGEMQAE